MGERIARALSTLFVGLYMVPSMAHVLEYRHKIALSPHQYLTVQQLYAGWAWAGAFMIGAFVAVLIWVYLAVWKRGAVLPPLIVLSCLIAEQIAFWAFVFPANRQTSNWTALPGNWAMLRSGWENGHLVGGLLVLTAFLVLCASMVDAGAQAKVRSPEVE